MVSYELPMGVVLISLAGLIRDEAGMACLNLASSRLLPVKLLPLWPLCLIWFILVLAETKRAPFDLPEAEAELVAGYNVEYSSMGFALGLTRMASVQFGVNLTFDQARVHATDCV